MALAKRTEWMFVGKFRTLFPTDTAPPSEMRDITIDWMVLQLPGLPEIEARRVAMEVARGLSGEELEGGPREIPALRVEMPASALENKSQLAKLIVAEMLREIRRAP